MGQRKKSDMDIEADRQLTKQQRQEKYDPKKLQVEPGHFDFTAAFMYDEELVRHNLNAVVRPNNVQVVAPALVKPVIKKPKPNFVR